MEITDVAAFVVCFGERHRDPNRNPRRLRMVGSEEITNPVHPKVGRYDVDLSDGSGWWAPVDEATIDERVQRMVELIREREDA